MDENKEATASEKKAPELNIYNELQFVAVGLSQLAWQLMGLQLGPGQKEVKKDMGQAKIAIDTVVFIVEKINDKLTPEQKKNFQNIISDLQLNFVKQK